MVGEDEASIEMKSGGTHGFRPILFLLIGD
jgi:hypothetical protein